MAGFAPVICGKQPVFRRKIADIALPHGLLLIDLGRVSTSLIGNNCRAHEAFRQDSYMAEGYCVKCKASKEIAEAVEVTMKNGRKATKGKCPACGTVMFKILGGKAVAAPNPNPPAA
jgi:ribosomal protein S27E